MQSNKINALAMAVVAFVTVIVAMFGFYYNLKTSETHLGWILVFELLFLVAVGIFVSWVKGGMKNE